MKFVGIILFGVAALCLVTVQDAHASGFNELRVALQNRLEEVNDRLDNSKNIVAFPEIKFAKQSLKEGDIDYNLPLLRVKLQELLPDYDGVEEDDPYIYAPKLSLAVKQFQRSVGLADDGVIGPATLSILNRTLQDEKKQIEVNLYRLSQPEWLGRPDLRIDVDIARYWLKAYEVGNVVFEMPVVVGSNKRQTNRFMTVMTGVRLNPGWTLPPTIKQEDYIPKLRSDPKWVSEQGVYIYTSWDRDAEPVDPTLIDWNYLSDNEIKAMRFYKNSGDANPLGEYRFLMNNKYDIYLHDTNQKYLFNRTARAKSSGCVRVFNPRKIAEFLLKDNPGWTPSKIDSVLAKGETYNVGAKRSIPVYFDYKTAWLDSTGNLVLGADIYDLDGAEYRDMISNIDVSG